MQTPFRLQLSGLLALSAVVLSGPAIGKGLDLVPMGVVEQAKAVAVDTVAPAPVAVPALAIPVPAAPAASDPVPARPEVAAAPAPAVSAAAPVPAPAVAPAAKESAPAPAPAPVASVTTVQAEAPAEQLAPAAAALVETPEPAEPAEEVWRVPSHGTLREMIESWGQRAGWRVVWDTDLDYPMEAAFEVRGDFVKAADAVFAAYWDAKEKFAVRAYSNNVLLVRQLGVNGK